VEVEKRTNESIGRRPSDCTSNERKSGVTTETALRHEQPHSTNYTRSAAGRYSGGSIGKAIFVAGARYVRRRHEPACASRHEEERATDYYHTPRRRRSPRFHVSTRGDRRADYSLLASEKGNDQIEPTTFVIFRAVRRIPL